MLFAGSVNSKEVSPKEDKREYLVMILKKKKIQIQIHFGGKEFIGICEVAYNNL